MPPPFCYEYPRPSVTVDLVVFAFDGRDLRSLFIRRKKDPFAGRWAIPGGFMEIDEPIEAAARRELREETGLDLSVPIALIGAFGAPGRDPRGRTISFAHATALRGPAPRVAGGDDASEAEWLDPCRPLELAFDHAEIMAAALAWLKQEVDGPGAVPMLPPEFSRSEVELLHRALGLPRHSAKAWLARMSRQGRIVSTGNRRGVYRATEANPPPPS